uniref:CARD domain-containing protein n=1 Tax=Seriola lalandi dorsalis TaxID=1841481 RepID=A0A3B4XAG3_SERLL
GPVLRELLDNLLQSGVVTDGEMDSAAGTPTRAEKARVVIDTVRRKGSRASSVLITALREVDPYLSTELCSGNENLSCFDSFKICMSVHLLNVCY